MKKQIYTVIIAGAICMPTMAMVDVYTGIDYRTTSTSYNGNGYPNGFDDTNNLSGYVAFEHFIPLLPNAKIKYSDLSTESNTDSATIESSATNAILYYQLFDNSLLEFDLGLAYTSLDSDFQNMSSDLSQAYVAAKFFIPVTGVNAFAEIISGSLSSDKVSDIELGLAYTFNPDSLMNVAVRAGYRFQDATINDFKQENKGLFAGVELHF